MNFERNKLKYFIIQSITGDITKENINEAIGCPSKTHKQIQIISPSLLFYGFGSSPKRL